MFVYDITQESTGCVSYPGTEPARRELVEAIARGDACNVSTIWQMAHNGTHCDAPCHFIEGGKSIDQLDIGIFIGPCILIEREGPISEDEAREDISLGYERILYKGDFLMTEEGAHVFAESGVKLIGNESSTFGPVEAPAAVHRILLGAGVVLLEGIRPGVAPAGEYILSAAPINYSGSDGCPCRAALIKL